MLLNRNDYYLETIMLNIQKIRDLIAENGLKVTPQRIAIFEALMNINGHPSAEMVKNYISTSHPSISLSTVYNILETFVEKGLIKKIRTENDIKRYDPIMDTHHHLYCQKSDTILDYYDQELDKILKEYFKNKNIPDFEIEDIKLHITGKSKNK